MKAKLTPNGLYATKESPAPLPPTELATFAAGCFWGVEDLFRKTKGVVATAVGYSGGHTKNPTYKEVCSDETGHAEVVRVEFDPKAVSFTELVRLFFDLHDPTQLNRQGPDEGSQYRSAVFFHSPEQKAAAERERDALGASGELARPIVTEVTAVSEFWPAEEYHQQYVEKGGFAVCHLRRTFPCRRRRSR
ncbi:MAG: peptide-methionine (S)-S-oxide reductase MsrA [Deltaproteobacteria bacterium]|nr:peptide-methionine (S)-S-oxide reductase MsrA [Deltaproteobacteria bacterium]